MPAATPSRSTFNSISESPKDTIRTFNSPFKVVLPGTDSKPQTPKSNLMSINSNMGGLIFDDVLRWDENEVIAWLQSVRLSAHSSAFTKNDISGAVLFDIDNGFLKEMGVMSVGDRIRITSAIKNLKKKCAETEIVQRSAHNRAVQGEVEWIDGEFSGDRESEEGGLAPQLGNTSSLRHSPMHEGLSMEASQSSHSPSLAGGRGTPTLRDMRGMGATGGWTLTRPRGDANGMTSPNSSLRVANYPNNARPNTAIGGSSIPSNSPTYSNFPAPRPSTSDGGRGPTSANPSINAHSAAALSPIAESSGFSRPSPRENKGFYSYANDGSKMVGSPPGALALDDVRKKTMKFIGEDGTSKVVSVADCRDAHDVLARVLRKFNKPSQGNSYVPTAGQMYTADDDILDSDDGGDLWGIFATSGEGQIKYLTDNELSAICHAPQPHDPLRERGLLLRRIGKGEDPGKRPTAKRSKLESFFGVSQDKITSNSAFSLPDDATSTTGHVTTEGKRMNRASTMSILSGLGVNAIAAKNAKDQREGPQKSPPHVSMIPKKARNFFGQRPPSELISSHLTDYFPSTEKRVLERTARRSIYGRPSTSIRSKRDSTWSFAADPDAPPLPSKENVENAAPAILIGMDGGDLHDNDHQAPILPPLRASMGEWAASIHPPNGTSTSSASIRHSNRPTSYRRTSGESSRSRQSLATKLRMARGIGGAEDSVGGGATSSFSKGDRSETASLLTVDEITQEVENRRESFNTIASSGWVVDEDGVPIPIPPTKRNTLNSSIAGNTRPSSGKSISLSATDDEISIEEGSDADITQRPSADAPGEETDRHFGDPMAITRVSDEDDPSDGLETDEDYDEEADDLSDEEGDGEGGVYQSAAPGREPIKWIKGALIGAGSFGNVFLGMNAKNGLLMAVKQVELPSGDSHSDQRKKSMLEALEREIELLKTLQHDNIVQYLDSYADGTHLNIFLEYVPGGSVAALLRNYGAFEEPLVRNFVKQILHGLNFLHSQDIVHRDIKGANILVDNKSCIKISDFGISKKTESGLYVTHRPSLQGSVFWMAPEVVKQTSYTRKADIWSLGCLVVEMISGTHPWANLNQMQALYQIGSLAKPSMPDEISAEAVDFLTKTFELDHTMRPSAEELLQHPFITEEFVLPSATSPLPDGNGSASVNQTVEDSGGASSNQNTIRSKGSKTGTALRKANKEPMGG